MPSAWGWPTPTGLKVIINLSHAFMNAVLMNACPLSDVTSRGLPNRLMMSMRMATAASAVSPLAGWEWRTLSSSPLRQKRYTNPFFHFRVVEVFSTPDTKHLGRVSECIPLLTGTHPMFHQYSAIRELLISIFPLLNIRRDLNPPGGGGGGLSSNLQGPTTITENVHCPLLLNLDT